MKGIQRGSFHTLILKKLHLRVTKGRKDTCDTVTCFSGLFLCSPSKTSYFDSRNAPTFTVVNFTRSPSWTAQIHSFK